MRKILLLATTMLAAPAAHAETLAEAVAGSLSLHPAVVSAMADQEAAGFAVDESFGALLPQVSVRADAGYQSALNSTTRNRARGPGQGSDVDTFRQSGQLTITQKIFDGLGVYGNIESAESQADGALFRVNDVREEIALRAGTAYLDMMRARELMVLAQRNVLRHQRTLQAVELQAQQGVGAGADVFQAESRLALARATLRERENQVRNAEADYEEAIGMPPDTLITFTVSDDAIPDTPEDAVAVALENDWELKALKADMDSAEADHKVARSAYYPSLDLELSSGFDEDTDGSIGYDRDHQALLVLSMDLYSGGSDTAAEKGALKRVKSAEARLQEAERLTTEDTRFSFNDYETARETLAFLRDRMMASENVVNAYQEQYQLGQISILDLLDVQNELFQARSDYVDGEYGLNQARMALLRNFARLEASIAEAQNGAQIDAFIAARNWDDTSDLSTEGSSFFDILDETEIDAGSELDPAAIEPPPEDTSAAPAPATSEVTATAAPKDSETRTASEEVAQAPVSPPASTLLETTVSQEPASEPDAFSAALESPVSFD